MIPERPDWMLDARCRDMDPAIFDLGKGGTVKAEIAKNVCRQCSVRVQCLNYALDNGEMHLVWGGTSPTERAKLRADRRRLGIAS